jgi:hypothetical protein
MLTWTLWSALKKPFTRHPVYYRALQLRKSGVGEVSFFVRPARKFIERIRQFASAGILARLLLLIIALPIAVFLIFAILYAGLPTLMYGGPILLPIIANTYGLNWAVGIGSLIATERERKTYDLLCVTPFGTLPTTWAITSGYAHYDQTLRSVSQLRAWQLAIIWVVVPFIGSMVIMQFGQIGYYITLIPVFIAYLAAFTAMLYIDQFQSIIVGVLVAMIIPTLGRAMQETRIWITGVFILLQFVTYLSALLICLGALPIIFDALKLRGVLIDFGLPVLSVVIFFLIHEAIIRWLWRVLKEQVGAEVDLHQSTELDPVLRGAL